MWMEWQNIDLTTWQDHLISWQIIYCSTNSIFFDFLWFSLISQVLLQFFQELCFFSHFSSLASQKLERYGLEANLIMPQKSLLLNLSLSRISLHFIRAKIIHFGFWLHIVGWISKDLKDLPPSRTYDFHRIRLST